MTDKKALVSIGMPVYNGERFIRQSLESLLAQDYENFELIISDNASTDASPEICREYLAKDKRIQYFKNERNLGAADNFNRVFELSSGKYFMWAADHDLWHPTFISRCISILETEPDVILVYPLAVYIDMEGNSLGMRCDRIDCRGMPLVSRYKYFMRNFNYGWSIHGLIRREALAKTAGFRKIWGCHLALEAELSLIGEYALVNEPLFFPRKNRPDEDQETRKNRVFYEVDPVSADEKCKRSYSYVYCEYYKALIETIANFPLGIREKLDLISFIAARFVKYSILYHTILVKSWLERKINIKCESI